MEQHDVPPLINNTLNVGFDISLSELKIFVGEMEKAGMNSVEFKINKDAKTDSVSGITLESWHDTKYE